MNITEKTNSINEIEVDYLIFIYEDKLYFISLNTSPK